MVDDGGGVAPGTWAVAAAFLARSDDLMVLIDEGGTVIWASPSTEHFFGTARDQVEGARCAALVHADDRQRVEEALALVIDGADRLPLEARTVTSDDTVRWVELVLTNLLDEPDVRGVVGHLRDITDRRRAQEAVQFQASVLDAVGQAITARDLDGIAIFWNPAATALFGYDAEEVLGRRMADFVSAAPGHEADLLAASTAHHEARPWTGVAVVTVKDGKVVTVQTTATPVFSQDGEHLGTITASHDLSEMIEAEQALIHQATHDPLTGLLHSRAFVDELSATLARDRHEVDDVVLVFIDLDRFKSVNDRLGHIDADEVIREVGQRLAAAVPERARVGRLGGDEFVVSVDQVHGHEEVRGLARDIQAALRRPVPVRGEALALDASIGIAIAGEDREADGLLRNADLAMYAAKRRGRGRAELFDEGLAAQDRRRAELVDELRTALEVGQLEPHFQPEYDLATGELFGFEALARWHHPTRGWVGPDEFIPLAEEAGLMGTLGRQMLAKACATLARWNRSWPGRTLAVGVNVSPFQLADPAFREDVRRAIEANGLRHGQLCLEVTESALMDASGAAAAVGQLRDGGATLAIDDFGTGYSSFGRLKVLRIDFLKIDRSFVADIGRSADDDVIVSTMTTLARSLGVQLIAEGIETQAQRAHLADLGCQYGQGFLWSPALPEAEATAVIERGGCP
jgi:diguanylate cyclase (GGDEF)-like protein/PAS domain S-box-containing protein